MVQWPPSPLVEDEVTALSHEHLHGIPVESVKSEDDPAVSRGSVDQYPIIVDSDDQKGSPGSPPINLTKQRTFSTQGDSSDDSYGPSTPSPINEKHSRRLSPSHRTKTVSFEEPTSSSKGTKDMRDHTQERGRPELSRIETNLGDDLKSMATGRRRAPSPYSYSSRPATDKQTPLSNKLFFSPVDFTASPVQTQSSKAVSSSSATGNGKSDRYEDDVTRRRHPSKSHSRQPSSRDYETQNSKPISSQNSSDGSSIHHFSKPQTRTVQQDGQERQYDLTANTITPTRSRRSSREAYHGTSYEDSRREVQSMRSGQDSGAVRDSPHVSPLASPYSSSAEESRKKYRSSHRRDSRHAKDEYTSSRPSSHRTERSYLDESIKHSYLGESKSGPLDNRFLHAHSVGSKAHLDSAAATTAETARKQREDYIEQAVIDNLRRPRQGLSVRTSGSAITSPLASPPRTPRSERQSKDYFELSTSIQRPFQSSRPSSMDESQMRDLKAHASLLSAATAGAAMAARVSGELSKSGSSSAEYNPSNSTSRPASTPRSRRTSPVFEDQRPSTKIPHHTPIEKKGYPVQLSTPVVNETRPLSRGSVYSSEQQGHPQFQRAFSYSGPDQNKKNYQSHSDNYCDARQNTSTAPLYPPVPVSRSRPVAVMTGSKILPELPSCPRSHPTAAFSDWWSMKEMSHLDICPSCASAIASTRFRNLLVRSLPRPYNGTSVCALSKPWLRVAFVQACQGDELSLERFEALSICPRDMRLCPGVKEERRKWFVLTDPSTRTQIPNFSACTDCVRAIDILFPVLKNLFHREYDGTVREGICSLSPHTKNSACFIDQLAQTATRCKDGQHRSADIQPLADYIRKATRYGDCAKDQMLTSRTWHFIPDLPEFTICEQCYYESVWPVRDRAVAREVSRNLQTVPFRHDLINPRGISCQLYSERMKQIFKEAVSKKDFTLLKEAARTRYRTQRRLMEINQLLAEDQKYGVDRRMELERNNKIWHSME